MVQNNEPTNSEEIVISEEKKNNTLPLAYVMYLTMRSQFIDELAKTDIDILHKWKEYENQVFLELEAKKEV